jgi:SNF2 family DNA or RNA helicase
MLLMRVGPRFVFHSTYTERSLPKEAGFRWSPDEKVWWTDDPKKASKLLDFADTSTRAFLKGQSLSSPAEEVAKSRAVDAKVVIPSPEGLQYLPFQKAGVAYASSRTSTLIGDEMGLGKTIQAIGVLNSSKWKRVLVVCPASLKINWVRELDKWLVERRTIEIAKTKKPFPTSDIVVINYDILGKFKELFNTSTTPRAGKRPKRSSTYVGPRWDYLIADECHYVKNRGSIRTKLLAQIAKSSSRKVFLTGTPILNRPVELWPVLSMLQPEVWKNFWAFAQRYCSAHHNGFGWDFGGASNLEELQTKLRSTLMIRRLKSEVLKDLPPKMRQVVEIPVSSKAVKEKIQLELQEWKAHEKKITKLQEAVQSAAINKDEEGFRESVKLLREAQAVAFQAMGKVRYETAMSKLPDVIEHLESVLETGRKVVCFTHHHDMTDALAKTFGSSVVVDGRVDVKERQARVDRFQTDPSCKLFLGGMKAAGVGLTLTSSSHVVFAEIDWVPGTLTQAEDRCHRIGQVDSVLVQHLVLEGSLDAYMAKRVIAKQEVIDKALDVKPLPKKEKGLDQKTLAFGVRYSTSSPPPASLPSGISVDALLRALKLLASRCDGATSLDGQGFNKMDSQFGRDLASRNFLTPKQALAAHKMITKYRRQLPQELRERIGLT